MEDPSRIDSLLGLINQLGLIGIVSVMLGTLTIIIAIAGLYAFFDVRSAAKRAAIAQATTVAKEVAEVQANAYLQAELPAMITAYLELAKNGVSADEANKIAAAQEDDDKA